jgi:hypothetical protein
MLLSEVRGIAPSGLIAMTDKICSTRMAAMGNMPYAKLGEQNAFTPFVRSEEGFHIIRETVKD